MTDFEFELKRFDEPDIQFTDGSSTSPKRGLFRHGPRLKNAGHHTINVGIIGDRDSIRRLNDLFTRMEGIIHPDLEEENSEEDEEDEEGIEISPWKVPYPGANPDSQLDVSIRLRDRWKAPIGPDVLMSLETKNTVRGKMEKFLDILEEDISFLAGDDPRPDVLVICIPSKVMDECTPEHQDHANVSADGSDLRNRIKLIGMENQIPTQLIKPSTLEINTEKQRASRAWNLTVGFLYKSQRGHPWKTKDLEEGACYAGISFYKVRGGDDNEVRAALAHVFARKDYNIIQSDPMDDLKEDRNGQPHLSTEGARQVVDRIVEYYKKRNRGRKPERLVLHKTSPFWEEERTGFKEGAGDIGIKDFVHIRTRNTGVRLFPDGDYPPLRGTLFSIPSEDRHFLYTTGYTPEMATYEGSNIPEPIEIRPDEQCVSSSDKICEEILFLTKLDWNTSDFAVKEPITLKVSRKVSQVLSEEYADPAEARPQYYYYM